MQITSETIYIAGPMRGHVHYNYPAFIEAEEQLVAMGNTVVSPVNLDAERGFDARTLPLDFNWNGYPDTGFSIHDTAVDALETIIRNCTAIFMLPGWIASPGAKAEKAVSEWLKLKVFESVKTRVEIIDETAEGYTMETRATNKNGGCDYLTSDGRMCAVGRCMHSPMLGPQTSVSGIMFRYGGLDAFLKFEYRGHSVDFWEDIQQLHDSHEWWNSTGLTMDGLNRVALLKAKWR